MPAVEYEFTILDTKVVVNPKFEGGLYYLPLVEGFNYRTPWYAEYGNL